MISDKQCLFLLFTFNLGVEGFHLGYYLFIDKYLQHKLVFNNHELAKITCKGHFVLVCFNLKN